VTNALHHIAENLPIVVSCGSLVVSVLSLIVSLTAKRQAKSAASLGLRHEAINHIRAAIYDVRLDGNITSKTVSSIREALQSSPLVFNGTVSNMLDTAYKIAFRLQSNPSERQTDQDERDMDVLAEQLDAILSAMNEQATLNR
jgi:hypothetical protein